jgi:hypothetical protein
MKKEKSDRTDISVRECVTVILSKTAVHSLVLIADRTVEMVSIAPETTRFS